MSLRSGGRASRRWRFLSSAAAPVAFTGSLIALGGHAAAQGAPPSASAQDSTQNAEQVIATGTRKTHTTVNDSAVPITVISAAELRETGQTTIRDALRDLVPSYNDSAGWTGGTGEAVKAASLRGLGADQTLVLVDGKRRHATSLVFVTGQGNQGTSPVDIDLIPIGMVDHIEILRDGAAAQYGSDALAGVINIILKKGSKNSEATATYGQYAQDITHAGQSGHVTVDQGAPIGNIGGFVRLDFDIQANNFTNPLGPALPYNSLYPAQTRLYDPGDPREYTATRQVAHQGLPLVQTYNFGYNTEIPLGDRLPDVTAYSFATFTHQFSQNYGIFRPPTSAQNIESVYPNGYTPMFTVKTNDGQIVYGVRGLLDQWHWDLSASYADTDANELNLNSLNPSLGPTSPTDFDNGHLIGQEWVVNLDVDKPIATHIFDKPLNVAGGLEYRWDYFHQTAGDPASYEIGNYVFPSGPNAGTHPSGGASGLGGFTPDNSAEHSRANVAAYIDLEQELLKGWTIGLAGRIENYSDVGRVLSGKLSTRYEVTRWLAVRGSISNGFRAPSLQQEYYSSTLPNYVNDVDHPGKTILEDILYVQPNSAIGEALGARALKPEQSTDYTFGFTTAPDRLTHLGIDFYRIDIHDRIEVVGPFSGSGVNKVLASIGQVPASVSYFANIGNTRSEGIDLTGDRVTDIGRFGTIDWTLASAFNWQSITHFADTAAVLAATGEQLVQRNVVGNLTVAYPKNRTTLGLSWTKGRWNVNVRESRYSEVTYVDQYYPARDSTAQAKFITDLAVTFHPIKRIGITVGADNLLNTYPTQLNPQEQLYYGWYGAKPVYNLYSPFGYNGGYYYVTVDVHW